MDDDMFLKVSEVSATLRVSSMTIHRLIKSGELTAVRVGRHYRIRESDLASYLSMEPSELRKYVNQET